MGGTLQYSGQDMALLAEVSEFAAGPDLPDDIDHQTAAYVLRTRATFNELREAAAQLAGLLVLASIGGRSRMLDLPALELAGSAHKEANALLQGAPVPSTAAHHHHHLSSAAERIGEALRIARQGSLRFDDTALDRTFQILKAGWREMLAAAKALPGYEVVNFGGCCAARRQAAPRLVAEWDSASQP